jgi:molybdopterin-guanine dinucleotide biosynthesis protein B
VRFATFVAAASNSGKTTLIEKVVRILKQRGLRVAVIKQTSIGFDLDKPGKDSFRFRVAGADAVVLVGPGEVAALRTVSASPSFEDLVQLSGDVDLILMEGGKNRTVNPIEVFRAGVSGDTPLCLANPTQFRALVSDEHVAAPLPVFDLNDAAGVADFLLAGQFQLPKLSQ